MLESRVPEFAATQRRQISGLLKKKSAIAYEQRLVAEVEARQLVDHALRLTTWAKGVVASHVE